ncbi:SMI1/KNR4 family protein [Streptomyces sp. NBC_01283]|uniref:SMI1/KNR4 family protein n=1 Tax=Streptomyces sp. NBC_01283 TaxID=2903812 RepID=UPI00352F892F
MLYRVARPWPQGLAADDEASERACEAVGCELFALDDLHVADASSRPCPWAFAAKEAAVTPPDAAVQGLVGSPGWIAFGDNGGGDRLAVDLTPGPRGHAGQIILLSHEEHVGASLVADSLTDLVRGQDNRQHHDGDGDRPPAVAHVNIRRLPSVEAAAHPGLEALSIGLWDAEPLSLAPVAALPRLRTLAAYPGTLADPLEIGELTALEFLEIGPAEWRVLLDAGAVPRSLSAAAIKVHGDEDRPSWPSPTRSWISGPGPTSSSTASKAPSAPSLGGRGSTGTLCPGLPRPRTIGRRGQNCVRLRSTQVATRSLRKHSAVRRRRRLVGTDSHRRCRMRGIANYGHGCGESAMLDSSTVLPARQRRPE